MDLETAAVPNRALSIYCYITRGQSYVLKVGLVVPNKTFADRESKLQLGSSYKVNMLPDLPPKDNSE